MTLTTVNSSGVKDDSIVNADIKSDAAIAGSKIDPDFGSQQIETTGADILCTNGQIQSFGGQNGLYIKRTVSGTSSGYSLFGNNTRTWALEYNSNQFSINDYTAVNAPRISIDENGYVGIGTTSQTGKLTIKNADDANINVLEVKNDNDNVSGGFSQSSAGDGTLFLKTNDPNDIKILFRSNGDSYFNGGNVGIGTDSPGQKLSVSGAIGHTDLRVLGDNANLSFYLTTPSDWRFRTTSGAERMRILSGGQVCIGTTAGPGEPGIYLGDGTNPAAHIYANGQDHLYILANAYFAGGWKYQGSGEAGSLTIGSGNLTFNTAPTGSGGNAISWNEVFQAKNSNGDLSITNGNLVLANGKGIDFGATSDGGTGTPGEILDDYETGEFTPELAHGATASGYSYQKGYYTKVGNKVFATYYVRANAGVSTNGNDLRISGLPFTTNSTAQKEGGGFVTYTDGFFGTTDSVYTAATWVPNASSYLVFYKMTDGVTVKGSDCTVDAKYIIGQVIFTV